ncbi:MAG: hypothetical protein H8E72_02485 [Candidatus Marinimicrobia bacterium]|nr:hypothetical protein [Candidatus Neomarinimicrobiota bacterium]
MKILTIVIISLISQLYSQNYPNDMIYSDDYSYIDYSVSIAKGTRIE